MQQQREALVAKKQKKTANENGNMQESTSAVEESLYLKQKNEFEQQAGSKNRDGTNWYVR